MIIPPELQNFYNKIYADLVLLNNKVEPILKDISKRNGGFHICDIKKSESLYQKIEITKEVKVNEVIDLFRATIIVPTEKEIKKVREELKEFFIMKEVIENREKKPELFIYDDLHLYLVFKDELVLDHEKYKRRFFELQIKTFLQYGWQKATHDLIYKGNELNWSNQRIAHQIKAMLEQSDQMLAEIELSAKICPKNEYTHFKNLNKIISLIKEKWDVTNLPKGLRKTAVNINELLRLTKISMDDFILEINAPDNEKLINNLSLSPFQSILAIIIKNYKQKLIDGLRKSKKKIYVCNSMKDFLGKIPPELNEFTIEMN